MQSQSRSRSRSPRERASLPIRLRCPSPSRLQTKKAFKPPLQAIKDKYYEMYRGKGGAGDDDFVVETQAEPLQNPDPRE